jgi:hypothetical protein
MGFMSALLELSSIPLTKRVEECIVDVKKAFPYGDIDLVHVDRPESLAIAQRIIDNVVCDLKMTLDRLMFDEGIDSLRDLDLGEYYSPFMTDEYNNCRPTVVRYFQWTIPR